jgi:hypothetical protein
MRAKVLHIATILSNDNAGENIIIFRETLRQKTIGILNQKEYQWLGPKETKKYPTIRP